MLILGQTTTQVWDGLEVVQQDAALTGVSNLVRDVTGEVAIQTADGLLSGGDRWGLTDRLGSTVGQGSGSRVSQVVSYSDWGIPTFATVGYNSAAGFTGELGDSVTGLSEYFARAYDPWSASWLQADPYRGTLDAPGTQNRYAYAEGNPVTLQDYYGYATRAVIDGSKRAERTLPTGPKGRGGPPPKPAPSSPDDYLGLGTDRHLPTCGSAGAPSCQLGSDPFCADTTLATVKPFGCQLDFRDETMLRKLLELGLMYIPLSWLGPLLGKIPGLLDRLLPLLKGPQNKAPLKPKVEAEPIAPPSSPPVTFGHGARHLESHDLTQQVVESTILAQVKSAQNAGTTSGSFWGRVTINGYVIEYRAYTLQDGTINVGTYYVLR